MCNVRKWEGKVAFPRPYMLQEIYIGFTTHQKSRKCREFKLYGGHLKIRTTHLKNRMKMIDDEVLFKFVDVQSSGSAYVPGIHCTSMGDVKRNGDVILK